MGAGTDTLIVVRHAMAGVKLPDPVRDFARGLDEHGLHAAAALPARLLEHVTPTTIVSSPFRRCLQTVRPLAGRLALGIDRSDDLRASASLDATVELLHSLPDGALVCTHGEVITALFGPMNCEKAAFLVVERDGGLLSPTLYVGPPEPAARRLPVG
jgi:8-oxo-dGTP diphosphatase